MPLNMKKTIAKGHFEKFNLRAENLDDKVRTIRVYLPPDYQQGTKRYPVLYMHDGQNLFFNKHTNFKVGAWRVHAALDRFYHEGNIEGFIVVGLDSSAVDRSREMSFFPVKKRFLPTKPQPIEGQQYSDFITKTLKNYIDSHYRTLQDTSYIGGSSMGGIASLVMALNHPTLFKGALCFTPAGMIHYQSDLKAFFDSRLNEMKAKQITLPKLYFMVGGIGLETIIKPFCDWTVPYFVAHGYEYGKNITYLYKPKAVHNEKAWEKVFPSAFMWMIN